jgi:hypothetical protein
MSNKVNQWADWTGINGLLTIDIIPLPMIIIGTVDRLGIGVFSSKAWSSTMTITNDHLVGSCAPE